MRKITEFRSKSADKQPIVRLANNNPVAMALLVGTLFDVASRHELTEDDINIVTTNNGRSDIRNLSVRIGETTWLVPFSKNFPNEALTNADYLLACQFRQSFLSVKDEDGVTRKVDDEGNVVLDMSKPYISFGKPEGITIKDTEKLFTEEMVGEDLAAAGNS